MTPDIPRHAESRLTDRLSHQAAVVLLGPRQVGKTTLARRVAANWPGGSVYLDMERPADRRRLDDADAYLRSLNGKLVVIDEIHRAPDLFELLRGIIDERRALGQRFGHFLLLGSASIELMAQASETLAGRAAYLDIHPFDLLEVQGHDIRPDTLWLRGGFPDSLLVSNDTRSLDWRRDFIRSYLERDVPMFAPRMPASTIGRLWTMLAHNQGELLNQSRLAQALSVSVPTVQRYMDLLGDLLLVRQLRPWSANLGKRLVKTPKSYVRDSGLVHALLELETLDHVLGHPVAGHSYEGWVIENLIAAAGPRYNPHFYRTSSGAEIDLLLERAGRAEIAIEIKRNSAPTIPKGFTQACNDLGITQRYLVYSGTDSYPASNGVQVIGLLEMMQILAVQA